MASVCGSWASNGAPDHDEKVVVKSEPCGGKWKRYWSKPAHSTFAPVRRTLQPTVVSFRVILPRLLLGRQALRACSPYGYHGLAMANVGCHVIVRDATHGGPIGSPPPHGGPIGSPPPHGGPIGSPPPHRGHIGLPQSTATREVDDGAKNVDLHIDGAAFSRLLESQGHSPTPPKAGQATPPNVVVTTAPTPDAVDTTAPTPGAADTVEPTPGAVSAAEPTPGAVSAVGAVEPMPGAVGVVVSEAAAFALWRRLEWMGSGQVCCVWVHGSADVCALAAVILCVIHLCDFNIGAADAYHLVAMRADVPHAEWGARLPFPTRALADIDALAALYERSRRRSPRSPRAVAHERGRQRGAHEHSASRACPPLPASSSPRSPPPLSRRVTVASTCVTTIYTERTNNATVCPIPLFPAAVRGWMAG